MALRQTTGFVERLLRLVGLDWAVPDFNTLSHRQKALAGNIPFRGSQGPLHLPVDSTGIKVEGEGEWNARKHGGQKRRVWRKIHIGIDEQTLEVRAVEVTSNDGGDAPLLPGQLNQIPCMPNVALPPSCHLAGTPSLGRPTAPGRLPATRHDGYQNTWAALYGDGGADSTADAVSKRRCIV